MPPPSPWPSTLLTPPAMAARLATPLATLGLLLRTCIWPLVPCCLGCLRRVLAWLHFFSLTGEHLRKMAPLGSDPRFHILGMASPLNIRYFGGQLYTTERFHEQPDVPEGRRILVFTPEGERLQVFRQRDEGALVPADVPIKHIAVVGSRLLVLARIVGSERRAMFALKGL